MSLHFDLKVNNDVIGGFVAQRQERVAPRMDAVYHYKITLNGVYAGEISHRYGDGAFALIAKALNELPSPNTAYSTPAADR